MRARIGCLLAGLWFAASSISGFADTPDNLDAPPNTITATTGGGNGIADIGGGMFSKPQWRLEDSGDPEFEKAANAVLAVRGVKTDGEGGKGFWRIDTVYVGAADGWTPPPTERERRAATGERVGRVFAAVFVGALELALTGNISIAPSIPGDSNMTNSANARNLTVEALDDIPYGAVKIAVLSVVNDQQRARQEVITVGYDNSSTEVLAKQARHVLWQMLGLGDGGAVELGDQRVQTGSPPQVHPETTGTVVGTNPGEGYITFRGDGAEKAEVVKIADSAVAQISEGSRVKLKRSLLRAWIAKQELVAGRTGEEIHQ